MVSKGRLIGARAIHTQREHPRNQQAKYQQPESDVELAILSYDGDEGAALRSGPDFVERGVHLLQFWGDWLEKFGGGTRRELLGVLWCGVRRETQGFSRGRLTVRAVHMGKERGASSSRRVLSKSGLAYRNKTCRTSRDP